MGASFRNIGEILELAGCDRLTIAPQLLQELEDAEGKIEAKLVAATSVESRPAPMTHAEFLWEHNQDAMAVEKRRRSYIMFLWTWKRHLIEYQGK